MDSSVLSAEENKSNILNIMFAPSLALCSILGAVVILMFCWLCNSCFYNPQADNREAATMVIEMSGGKSTSHNITEESDTLV